jgi:hypothetical protein
MGDEKYYSKGGVNYERVTSILGYFKSPELVKWELRVGSREAKRIKTVAMKRGTNVDDAIRIHVTEGKAPKKFKTIEEENCFKAYLQWRKDYGVQVVTSATTLYDEEALIAGTPDLWMLDETLDIKCASSIRDNYWLQTEWYARKKGHNFKSILRLDSSLGIYEYKKMPVSEYHSQVFDALITAYRFYNQAPPSVGIEEVEV